MFSRLHDLLLAVQYHNSTVQGSTITIQYTAIMIIMMMMMMVGSSVCTKQLAEPQSSLIAK